MKIFLSLIIILFALVVIPMSYYNMYHILKAVNANDLMWFFYWFSLPIVLITSALGKIIELIKED